MKEWVQAVIAAIERNTVAINHQTQMIHRFVLAYEKRPDLSANISSTSSIGMELSDVRSMPALQFLELADKKGMFPIGTSARAKSFVQSLIISSRYEGDPNSWKYQRREILRKRGFDKGAPTIEDLAALFRDGLIRFSSSEYVAPVKHEVFISIPNFGVTTFDRLCKVLKEVGLL